MLNKRVSILIPNYKSLALIKLCLDQLQQYTDLNRVEVIVIDNCSQDQAAEYLRSLDWITLIERQPEKDDTPPLSHSRALDLAMQQVSTPYVLNIHSDAFIIHPNWLNFLLSYIEKSPTIAGVGSWKLETKTFWQKTAKIIERSYQLLWYFIIRKKDHAVQGAGKNYYYLRSHCALYRTDLLKKHQLTFSMDREPAGKVLHKKLLDLGYQMIFLPSETLGKYLIHANHATTALNPELGSRKKSIVKRKKRLKKVLSQLTIAEK